MHIVQKILLAGLLALTVYAFWPRDNDQVPAIEQWQMAVERSGSTRFMGVVLGEATFADVQLRFDEPGEVAVFARKDSAEEPQLEVFFDDLPDDGRMILNLDAGPEMVEKIIRAGYRPVILPDGTVRFGVPPEFVGEVRRLKVNGITFLPPVRLDRKSFEAVYGKAAANVSTGDGNLHLLYPELGLDFIRSEEGVDILQLVPLSEYEKLVAPLKKALLDHELNSQQPEQQQP
ncbi:MAG: hypothetical protein K9M17_07815 [Mariprofundaceae bacterium]|nr:hypothetical protein [Mariprofundaceae bacterium]MDT8376205.1 hypothetical protein [Mariprofundaceae bacterium]